MGDGLAGRRRGPQHPPHALDHIDVGPAGLDEQAGVGTHDVHALAEGVDGHEDPQAPGLEYEEARPRGIIGHYANRAAFQAE